MTSSSAQIVTRFAPSPTGFLHIGGVRTAIFNYLWAKGNGGQFKLRIEDTDAKRSTPEAIEAILDGLSWMGLDPTEPLLLQSTRQARHTEVVKALLASGKAYKCYMSAEELAKAREAAQAQGQVYKYDRRWRDRPESQAPEGRAPSIRFKMPLEGQSHIDDQVQGKVTVQNAELDDLVIMRADGTPTYNLAVVVDDHDMGVTHVVRGDDHLNNAFRQQQIYAGLGWAFPVHAHIPLIHGQDGAKLSKRHGALGVDAYRDMGFLMPAIFNYLLRLGWSKGDQEFFSREEALESFSLQAINKAPSRFDLDKLRHINHHYMRQAKPEELLASMESFLPAPLDDPAKARCLLGMSGLVERASDLKALAESAALYIYDDLASIEDKAKAKLDEAGLQALILASACLKSLAAEGAQAWQAERIEADLKAMAKVESLKVGAVFMPLRAALTGSMSSPAVPEVAAALGPDLTIRRIEKVPSLLS